MDDNRDHEWNRRSMNSEDDVPLSWIRDILDAIPEHIAVVDPSGKILGVNQYWRTFAEQNGLASPEFCVGSNYLELTRKASGENSCEAQQAAAGIEDVLVDQLKSFELDYPCHSPFEKRWFRMSVRSLLFGGRKLALICHRNITTQRQLEDRLRSNEAKVRSIFEGSSDATMLLNESGFFDCNANTLKLFGIRTKEEFCKLSPGDVSPLFQPCGTNSQVLAQARVQEAIVSGSARFEWYHKRTSGEIFPAEVLLTAFDYEGSRVLQASVRDITVRKQDELKLQQMTARLQLDLASRMKAEEKLREATSYLDAYRMIIDKHGIVDETDLQGNITRVNEAFCEISGYTQNELVGNNHRMLNSGVHPPSMWRDLYETILAGNAWHGEICNRAKDGRHFWVATTIAPLNNINGEHRGYFAIRTDITALKTAQAHAIAASRTKSEFLANMSHEIRTPMTAILGYCELLSDLEASISRDPEDRLAYINIIRRNGEHLLAIINDILDISKIEAGKLIVDLVETRPIEIVEEVLSLMRVKARTKGIEVETVVSSLIPNWIVTDPFRLKQILFNLVGNAIKFTEQGKVQIKLSFLDDTTPEFRVDVVDTGIGMNSKQLERIFQPFEQADTSTTRRFGGTGLGLRISKRLAEIMGGSLEVTSQPGIGSCFTLSLEALSHGPIPSTIPVQVALPSSPEPTQPTKEPPSGKSLEGIRILLAEDGIDNQRLISHYLQKEGATVVVVENGKLACEAMTVDHTLQGPLCDPPPFDLIITDMHMPEMDGYSSTRILRTKGCTLPILALTANAMTEDVEKSAEAGCNIHLPKPIQRTKLIQACLDWSKRPSAVP